MSHRQIIEMGENLEKLGKLLQKPSTKLVEVVAAARACGLSVNFNIVDIEPNNIGFVVEREAKDDSEECNIE